MTHAIRIAKQGGPEEMKWEIFAVPPPGPGEVRVRHTAVGLNYIDTYHRSGLYPLPMPSGLGVEGAGVVQAVGEGVTEFAAGDRIAYAGGSAGAYAEVRNLPAAVLVKIPEGVDDRHAAAMMLQGMTAQFLLRRTYKVQKGDTILVHAAAGGVGLIMCQWARHLGATVIGTVGSDAKAELAKANGCDHPIVYTRENFKDRVREITKGDGVPVVYDSIGRDTFLNSLDCLRPFGLMVTFGNASGPVEPFNPAIMGAKGSLFLTRPTLFTHIAKRPALLEIAGELFDVVKKGAVKISINQTYALKDAAQAHRDLEARKTTGSTVLLP